MQEQEVKNSEWREFRAHNNLLETVIKRQEGSLHKAICEAVQNSIDANATEVRIKLSSEDLEISDNGQGFAGKTEINQFFEVFGLPHDALEDKTFGQFRMGRGQLFMFGVNIWRSNNFVMTVDLKKGLGYEFSEVSENEKVQGCIIRVTFKNQLHLTELCKAIKAAVFWSNIPVYLNDELISHSPSLMSWDIDTEYGYVLMTGGNRRSIYDRGFLVTEESSYNNEGCVIVSKQALQLNFARNTVSYECPVYTILRNDISEYTAKIREKRKKVLKKYKDDHFKLLELKLPDGVTLKDIQHRGETFGYEVVEALPIVTDVTGQYWSIQKLNSGSRYYKSTLIEIPCNLSKEDIDAYSVMNNCGFGLYFTTDMFEILRKIKSSNKIPYCSLRFLTQGTQDNKNVFKDPPQGSVQFTKLTKAGKKAIADIKANFENMVGHVFSTADHGYDKVQPVKIKIHKGGPQTFTLNKFEISVREDIAEWISPSSMFMIFYCWCMSSISRFSFNSEDMLHGRVSNDLYAGRAVSELLAKFCKFMHRETLKESTNEG